jgi:phospholipid/cholesterol/gamma-HCH transport system substrate-binding protein
MRKNIIETFFGGVVLIIAAFFLTFAYSFSNVKKVNGYPVIANFQNVIGIEIGSDVVIGGYKIGTITDIEMNDDYFMKTTLTIKDEFKNKIPTDSIAIISSPGLLSEKVVSIEPGIEEEYLQAGQEIVNTQAGASIEQLLGKVIFSLTDKNKDE